MTHMSQYDVSMNSTSTSTCDTVIGQWLHWYHVIGNFIWRWNCAAACLRYLFASSYGQGASFTDTNEVDLSYLNRLLSKMKYVWSTAEFTIDIMYHYYLSSCEHSGVGYCSRNKGHWHKGHYHIRVIGIRVILFKETLSYCQLKKVHWHRISRR